MTSYTVRHRESDDMWVIYSGGTPIETFSTKRPAKRRARELAGPNDTLTVYGMSGGVTRDYNDPRR